MKNPLSGAPNTFTLGLTLRIISLIVSIQVKTPRAPADYPAIITTSIFFNGAMLKM